MAHMIFAGTMPVQMTACKADPTPEEDAMVKKGKARIEAGKSAVVFVVPKGDRPSPSDAARTEGVDRLVFGECM